jgi:hypothetical protein
MKPIDFEYLLEGNYYYIFNYELGNKLLGSFSKIYFYNNYSIAVFDHVKSLNKNDNSLTSKSFLINDYYFNYTFFYVPEIELLLLKQVLRQKVDDNYLRNEIIKYII